MGPLPGGPPDVLALPVELATERLAASGYSVVEVFTTAGWRPEPPPRSELRVVRQRTAGAGVQLVVAAFRPPAGTGREGLDEVADRLADRPAREGGTAPRAEGGRP